MDEGALEAVEERLAVGAADDGGFVRLGEGDGVAAALAGLVEAEGVDAVEEGGIGGDPAGDLDAGDFLLDTVVR